MDPQFPPTASSLYLSAEEAFRVLRRRCGNMWPNEPEQIFSRMLSGAHLAMLELPRSQQACDGKDDLGVLSSLVALVNRSLKKV